MDVQNILVVLFLRHTSIDILTLRGLRSNHLHYPGDERDWKYGQLENKLETNIYYWYNILKFNWIFAELKPRSPRSSSFRVKWNIYQTLFKHSMECKYLRCHDFACLKHTYIVLNNVFHEDIDNLSIYRKTSLY